MKSSSIAVLLTCHNRCEKTIKCLHALFQCILPENYEIDVFLVDDGSTDGTSEMVKSTFPSVHVIQGDGALYWNRGMHLAWEVASGVKDYDFYLWLNDDTFLFQNSLETLISNVTSTKNEAIIVATTCSKEAGTLTYGGFNSDGKLILPKDDLVQAFTFNGNCILVPKLVFRSVGNLDPLFWHCIGDIDYGQRALKKGIKSFVGTDIMAYCEGHDRLPKWCLKEVSFLKRIQSLYSPLGNSHPYYFFHYEYRHFGFWLASKHFLSIHLRVILPHLWK